MGESKGNNLDEGGDGGGDDADGGGGGWCVQGGGRGEGNGQAPAQHFNMMKGEEGTWKRERGEGRGTTRTRTRARTRTRTRTRHGCWGVGGVGHGDMNKLQQ